MHAARPTSDVPLVQALDLMAARQRAWFAPAETWFVQRVVQTNEKAGSEPE
jgi:hypothetical protein